MSAAARTATPRSTLRSVPLCGCTMLTLASAVAGRILAAVDCGSSSSVAASIAAEVSSSKASSASCAPRQDPSFLRDVMSAR